MKPKAVKYVATVENVRELALMGAADLAWWREYLAGDDLEPIEEDGCAQVMLVGIDAKWMGIPLREISIIVAARCKHNLVELGYLLASAFNASRFMTFFERHWFHTPYTLRVDQKVTLGDSSSICLGRQPTPDLFAELGPREASERQASPKEMGFTGPLIIPAANDRTRRAWFMITIHGLTSTFDFDSDRDRFELGPKTTAPIFDALRDSQFRPKQWFVREHATHARGKTCKIRR